MRNLLLILILAGMVAVPAAGQAQSTGEGDVIIVKMIDKSTAEWRFEPSDITARPGDTIRFLQEDIVPHNVEFTSSPEGAELADKKIGAFLLARGDIYEIVVDARFLKGVYDFVCTPHAPLGMKGTLTVSGSAAINTR